MQVRAVLVAAAFASALTLAGCDRQEVPATASVGGSNPTAVLGGYGPGSPRPPAAAHPLVDADGNPIPSPPIPSGTQGQAVRATDDSALAIWVQDGHVVGSFWTRERGWATAQPLEQIYGNASDPQLVGNGSGVAMAVWRHTVGSIQSLRYSRFDERTGWATPDVLPGALPRPDAGALSGYADAPRLQMDARGNVVAEWPSGFAANEMQTARYVEGRGWSRATSEPVASAPNAPPSPGAPSPGL